MGSSVKPTPKDELQKPEVNRMDCAALPSAHPGLGPLADGGNPEVGASVRGRWGSARRRALDSSDRGVSRRGVAATSYRFTRTRRISLCESLPHVALGGAGLPDAAQGTRGPKAKGHRGPCSQSRSSVGMPDATPREWAEISARKGFQGIAVASTSSRTSCDSAGLPSAVRTCGLMRQCWFAQRGTWADSDQGQG